MSNPSNVDVLFMIFYYQDPIHNIL